MKVKFDVIIDISVSEVDEFDFEDNFRIQFIGILPKGFLVSPPSVMTK